MGDLEVTCWSCRCLRPFLPPRDPRPPLLEADPDAAAVDGAGLDLETVRGGGVSGAGNMTGKYQRWREISNFELTERDRFLLRLIEIDVRRICKGTIRICSSSERGAKNTNVTAAAAAAAPAIESRL